MANQNSGLIDSQCPICGRDFREADPKECPPDGTPCYADDDCPSFFEELGIRNPDYPECWAYADEVAAKLKVCS